MVSSSLPPSLLPPFRLVLPCNGCQHQRTSQGFARLDLAVARRSNARIPFLEERTRVPKACCEEILTAEVSAIGGVVVVVVVVVVEAVAAEASIRVCVVFVVVVVASWRGGIGVGSSVLCCNGKFFFFVPFPASSSSSSASSSSSSSSFPFCFRFLSSLRYSPVVVRLSFSGPLVPADRTRNFFERDDARQRGR